MKITSIALRSLVLTSLLTVSVGFSSAQALQVQDEQMIKNNYDQSMERCSAMEGADRDICQQEAKAQRDDAKADAKQAKKEAEAREEAAADKRKADYKVAKEKCEAMSGDAEDACLADARAQFAQ